MEELNGLNKNDDASKIDTKLVASDQEHSGTDENKGLSKTIHDEPKEKALIDKILKVTLIIKAKFPELSKFLDEIPGVELDYNHPEISLSDLSEYYQSLNSILEKYQLDHPDE